MMLPVFPSLQLTNHGLRRSRESSPGPLNPSLLLAGIAETRHMPAGYAAVAPLPADCPASASLWCILTTSLCPRGIRTAIRASGFDTRRSEEHTSELQSL